MPYDPHTISLEAELSTLPERPYEDVAAQTMVPGSVALAESPRYPIPDLGQRVWTQRSIAGTEQGETGK